MQRRTRLAERIVPAGAGQNQRLVQQGSAAQGRLGIAENERMTSQYAIPPGDRPITGDWNGDAVDLSLIHI